MTDRELADDGAVSDLPWASVFDAAANVRALSAVQSQGFRAASRLVDRFVKSGNSPDRTEASAPPEAVEVSQNAESANETHATVDRLIGGWETLTAQLARSLSNSAPAQARSPVFDVGGGATVGGAVLRSDMGGAGSVEVWLHNGTAEDLGTASLRCSDLLAHDGALVDAAAVCFDPEVVQLPALSSRGVAVRVAVGSHVQPGVYRGTLLVDGHPDIWMPIELCVRSSIHDG
jgi:hypothetical protein